MGEVPASHQHPSGKTGCEVCFFKDAEETLAYKLSLFISRLILFLVVERSIQM